MLNLKLGYTQKIIGYGTKHGLLRNQLAYVLATAYWETARTMRPVKEAYWVENAEAWRKKNLRYYPWYGRGFVQLTWHQNYIRAGKELGLDLTTVPEKVMEPDISAEILVVGSKEGWFTAKKLSDYITLSKSNFYGARKIINGTDKAREIANIAIDYNRLLKADGYGESQPHYVDPAEELIEESKKSGIDSTTNLAAGATAVTTTVTTVSKITEATQQATDGVSAIISAGPWVLLLLIGLGAAWWIWNKRQKRAKLAKLLT